jgi:alpha-ketoglutarate-dependent taurine dioxygenase
MAAQIRFLKALSSNISRVPRRSFYQDHAVRKVSDRFANGGESSISRSSSKVTGVEKSSTGQFVAVEFAGETFTFHSQWLHDAQVDDGPYKQATNTYACKSSLNEVQKAVVGGHGSESTVEVSWKDGKVSRFPSVWLRVYAPLVANSHSNETTEKALQIPQGWLVNTLKMPEISYSKIFPEISVTTACCIYEILVHESFPGILKIVDLPPPVVEDERKGEKTILASVLKQIFGSVFSHPRRGPDVAYTMASHHQQYTNKGQLVSNYNLNNLLLPHIDQSMYQLPSLIDGLFNVEGESLNTFLSCPAVLQTLREEHPELVDSLFTTPMAFGRVAHIYSPPQYQGTTPTAVISPPGFPYRIHRFHWNPHQVGSLLCSFSEYPTALLAHRKFQEISSRETHLLKVRFKPGDMYLWSNHKVLHGREEVLKVPRTGVGQTVPEQVVLDGWREMLIGRLLGALEEKWLVQVPLAQLYELDKIVNG